MPWKEATKLSERLEMVKLYNSGLYAVTELAEMFHVSRPTVYEWTGRYAEQGEQGLVDRPPIAKSCPHRTDAAIAERIVAAKQLKPHWGPNKLLDWLRLEDAETIWPASSTAGEILNQRGLVQKRRKRRRTQDRAELPYLESLESGRMMTGDHKGEFRLGNGRYCYPLTICDPVSRFVYAIDAVDSTSIERAQPVFRRVFKEYGLPQWILSDRGGPFCCNRALRGLTRLSVWWIKLGITPVRIHPGCPWENGRHERMHKTLKAEATRPPSPNERNQQMRFDVFRTEFNEERPHESLGGKTPRSALKPCPRPYPRRTPQLEYPGHFEVRRVRSGGCIKWRGDLLFVSEALIGETVGLDEISDGVWSLHFGIIELARWSAATRRFI